MAVVSFDVGERRPAAVEGMDRHAAPWLGSSVDLTAPGFEAQLQTTLNAIPAYT